ncbi:hypothetical protein WN943_008435 [Citrus x changshan-huyou]
MNREIKEAITVVDQLPAENCKFPVNYMYRMVVGGDAASASLGGGLSVGCWLEEMQLQLLFVDVFFFILRGEGFNCETELFNRLQPAATVDHLA